MVAEDKANFHIKLKKYVRDSGFILLIVFWHSSS